MVVVIFIFMDYEKIVVFYIETSHVCRCILLSAAGRVGFRINGKYSPELRKPPRAHCQRNEKILQFISRLQNC